MQQKPYYTDLSDAEWTVLEPYFPPPRAIGRPRRHPVRTLLNAIFYVVRSSCPWRLLPRELPPWKTVYHYFRQWHLDGTWERVHTALRMKERERVGRDPHPSAGIIDSQSVKTTGVGDVRGYDGGKKVKGRKRHLLVDTQGLILRVCVHPANIMDRDGITLVLADGPAISPRLSHLWLDAGYDGRGKGQEWVEATLGWCAQIVQHQPNRRLVWAPAEAVIDWDASLPPPGFQVLSRRWCAERTCAWLDQNRRLSKDYERLCATSEAVIDATRVRHIAARADVSEGALYRHYRSKEAVAQALYQRHLGAYAARLGAIAAAQGSVRERLQQIIHMSLAVYRAAPDALSFVLIQQPTFMPGLPADAVYPLDLIEGLMRAGQAQGTIRAGRPNLLAAIFLGCLLRPIIVARLAQPGALDLLHDTRHDPVIAAAAWAAVARPDADNIDLTDSDHATPH